MDMVQGGVGGLVILKAEAFTSKFVTYIFQTED